MSLKKWLGQALVYLVLEVGALCGVPMRPDEIEQLMKISERSTVQVVQREDEVD